MADLKPCPFCGEQAGYYAGCAFCAHCGAEGPNYFHTRGDVDWNTRAPLASDEELRVLQRQCEELYGNAAEAFAEYATGFSMWPPYYLQAALEGQRRAATLSALERRLRKVE